MQSHHIYCKITPQELSTLQTGGSIHINWKKVKKVLGVIAEKIVKPALTVAATAGMATLGVPPAIGGPSSKLILDSIGDKIKGKGLGLGAGVKKTNPWISHVMKVKQEKGCSYKEAMKLAKESYNKSGKGIYLA